jgi:3-dehydrosphinganine reductase
VLRQELKPGGITVTAVYPPDVDRPMLLAESPLKPPELQALSSGENVLTADQVARALLEVTETGKARVLPGVSTLLLRLAAGATAKLLARYVDATIAKAQRTMRNEAETMATSSTSAGGQPAARRRKRR